MKHKKLMVLLLAAVIVTGTSVAIGTNAYFTSTAQSQNNTFKTGTLILGGIIDSKDVKNQFQTLEIKNMQPGRPYSQGITKLKNVGSLPMKIYRITASSFSGDTSLLDDRYVIVNIDMINKDNVRTHAYTGRLNNLTTANGGYFNPIYNIAPNEVVDMEVSVMIDPNAGNSYQGKEMKCDLTVYASQNNMPNNGEPVGTVYQFQGPKTVNQGDPNFTVVGVDDGTYLNFTYTWNPWDVFEIYRHQDWLGTTTTNEEYEFYSLGIKLASDDPKVVLDTFNIAIDSNWTSRDGWISIDTIASYNDKSIYTDNLRLKREDIKVDFDNNTISIKKSALPAGWKVCEVKFGGIQRPGMPKVYTDYQQMSLNK